MMVPSVTIQVVAERVLNSIPEGLLIAAFAWLLLRVIGRQNSRTRFAIWFISLVAIAVLPFVPAPQFGNSLRHAAHAEFVFPAAWATWLVTAWGVVAFFALARLGFGLVRLEKLRCESIPVREDELAPSLLATIEECRSLRAVDVRVSDEVRVPTAIGFLRPTILIPAWSLRGLSTEELRTVVLHEFAHLRRRDDWSNLAQKFVRAIFFFHPAVLWVEKRLSLEREMACDDLVLEKTGNAHAYARCLLSLAEKSLVQRSIALAQAAIGRARETSSRIAEILRVDRAAGRRGSKLALAAVGGVVAIAAVMVSQTPRLITFQSQSVTDAVALSDRASAIPQAMLVPVVARMDGSKDAQVKPAKLRMNEIGRPSSSRVIPAKAHRPARQPMLVRAKLQTTEPMLVMTETTSYFQHGSGIVGVTEWRVMLVNVPVQSAGQVQAPNRT